MSVNIYSSSSGGIPSSSSVHLDASGYSNSPYVRDHKIEMSIELSIEVTLLEGMQHNMICQMAQIRLADDVNYLVSVKRT
jgi:hypothetical protein